MTKRARENERVFLSALFLVYLKIGAFTFGGGYAMLPIIQAEVVDRRQWIKRKDFLQILALTQSAPGALAVNSAVLIGYRLHGIPGALVTVLGAILPSFLIIILIATFFIQFQDNPIIQKAFTGIRPVVAALIFAAVVRLGRPLLWNYKNIFGFVFFLAAGFFFNLHPIIIIIGGGVAGLLFFRVNVERKKGDEGEKSNDPA